MQLVIVEKSIESGKMRIAEAPLCYDLILPLPQQFSISGLSLCDSSHVLACNLMPYEDVTLFRPYRRSYLL